MAARDSAPIRVLTNWARNIRAGAFRKPFDRTRLIGHGWNQKAKRFDCVATPKQPGQSAVNCK